MFYQEILRFYDSLLGSASGLSYSVYSILNGWYGAGLMWLVGPGRVPHNEVKWCFLCGGIWPGVMCVLGDGEEWGPIGILMVNVDA